MRRWSPALFHASIAALLTLCFADLLGFVSATAPLLLASVTPMAAALALSFKPVWAAREVHYARLELPKRGLPRLAADVATVFGAGLTPKGSGTVGALAALPAGILLAALPPWARAGALVALTALATQATRVYLTHERSTLDPSEVVVDEWIGVLLALAFVPWSLCGVILAFALFRVLDIVKPGPIGWVEHRLPGALGVMSDDVLAGLIAGATLAGLGHFAPSLFSC